MHETVHISGDGIQGFLLSVQADLEGIEMKGIKTNSSWRHFTSIPKIDNS